MPGQLMVLCLILLIVIGSVIFAGGFEQIGYGAAAGVLLLVAAGCITVYFATNEKHFAFEKDEFQLLNGFRARKRVIPMREIKCLVVTGASMRAHGSGSMPHVRLGFWRSGRNGKREFIYYPYVLLRVDSDVAEYRGPDARYYNRELYGFTILGDNERVFERILKMTNCPIYVDERVLRGNERVAAMLREDSAAASRVASLEIANQS